MNNPGGVGGHTFHKTFLETSSSGWIPTFDRLLAKLAIAANQDGDDEEDEESNQPAAHLWLLLFFFIGNSQKALKNSILHNRKKMENIKGVKHIKSC